MENSDYIELNWEQLEQPKPLTAEDYQRLSEQS